MWCGGRGGGGGGRGKRGGTEERRGGREGGREREREKGWNKILSAVPEIYMYVLSNYSSVHRIHLLV